MDNDGKVTDLVEQSKLTFLREAIEDFNREQRQYDLGREFANTRKNRTPLVGAMIVGTIVLFALGAWAITLYIQKTSSKVSVSIADFQEVNLREVLDAAKRLDNQMQDATAQKTTLEQERDAKIALAQQTAQQQIQLLSTQNLSEAQIKSRTAAIDQNLAAQTESIRAEYQPKIDAIDQQIKNIQAQQAQYDSRQVEQAKKQEEILNNQRKLFDMQLAQQQQDYDAKIAAMKADYEKQISDLKAYHDQYVAALEKKHAAEIQALIQKYNPTFTDAAVVGLLNAPIDATALQSPTLADFNNLLSTNNVVSRDAYNKIAADLANYQAIIARLKQIPYENSVPTALKQLEYRNLELIRSLESVWQGLVSVVNQKDQTIAQRNQTISSQSNTIASLSAQIGSYTYGLDSLVQTNRENGYIIDPRDPNNILVYVNKVRQIADGTTALVFRNDDQSIGSIRFTVANGVTRAAVVKLTPNQQIMPFDKILIQVQQ